MFNEGVDLPEPRHRPDAPADGVAHSLAATDRSWTASKVRRQGRSSRVIDYIGNHRTFLDKPRALLTSLLGVGESHEELRAALMAVQRGDADLPDGCSVTYDLEAVKVLERLLRPTTGEQRFRAAYEEFRERHGRRPAAAELHAEGALTRVVLRRSATSWHRFVDAMGDLTAIERAVVAANDDFLREVEHARMERSYKMLLLQAMIELEALPGSLDEEQLAQRLDRIARRSPRLREELEATLAGESDLVTMVRQNPIRAWCGTKRGKTSEFFDTRAGQFRTRFEVPDEQRATFVDLVRELVDWRLAEYLDRTAPTSFECRVAHNGRHPILMLPARQRAPYLPTGLQPVRAEGELFEAQFAKIAINVMRPSGEAEAENALPDLLRYWFGEDAGQPGSGNVVRCVLDKDAHEMVPVARRSQPLAVRDDSGHELDAHFLIESSGEPPRDRLHESRWQEGNDIPAKRRLHGRTRDGAGARARTSPRARRSTRGFSQGPQDASGGATAAAPG